MSLCVIPSALTWIIVGMGDNKHFQRLIVPLIRVIGNVKALFPYAPIRVVKLEEGVHVQHLKLKMKQKLLICLQDAKSKKSKHTVASTAADLLSHFREQLSVQKANLDVCLTVAAGSKLAILRLDSEESGAAVEG